MISKNNIVLGLDISTSVVGWCIMKSVDSVLDAGYVDLRKIKEDSPITLLFKKADIVIPEIIKKCKKYKVGTVVVETPLGMAMGKNINSAIMLNRFNFIIGYQLYSEGYYIRYETSQRARKKLFGDEYKTWFHLPSQNDTKKEYITNFVKEHIEKFVKFEHRPIAKDKWKSYLYDVADAYVVAKSFYIDI